MARQHPERCPMARRVKAQPGRKTGMPVGAPPRGPVMQDPQAIELLEHLSSGGTLRSYCAEPGRPAVSTVHLWKEEDSEFSGHYRAARKRGQEALLEEAQALADIRPEDAVEGSWRRLQVDTRLRILRMWDPARWGERVQHEHAGGISLTVQTGVPHADDRLLP